jgi:hypothetical protein
MATDVQMMDLDQLAAMASGEGGMEALAKLANGEEPPEPNPVVEPEEEKAPEPEKTPAVEEKPDEHASAVSTKDGKGTIPYSVLKGARERASTLQSENEVLRKQIDEITQRATQATTPAEKTQSIDVMDERIQAMRTQADAMRADFPELASMFETQAELLAENRKEIETLRGSVKAEEEKRQAIEARSVEEQVQDAIDGNPDISRWSAEGGPLWQAAVDADAMLRQNPEWVGKTYEERFEKVVAVVKALHPEAQVTTVPASDSAQPQVSTSKTPAKAKAPAYTLSDIPGGMATTGGAMEQVETMSATQINRMFMNMTPEQTAEYLSSLSM